VSVWPFVLRRDYEWLQRWMLDERKFFEDQAISQADRYEALLAKYHALRFQRVEGTSAVVAVEPTAPVQREPADPLKALIAELCGTDLRKRAMMLRQLAADRAEGMSAERIEEAIRQGVQPEGVPL
jgi:hypothetical protein